MLRQIVTPKEKAYTLYLPDELIGKRIELLAFELPDEGPSQSSETRAHEISAIFAGCSVDLRHFKFDRNSANDYE